MVDGFTAIKKYNETCVSSDDCYDDRMVCAKDENNIDRCFCSRFHRWNETSEGCVQVYSIAYIINQTVSVHEYQEKLFKEQDAMFRGPAFSGFFILVVMLICCIMITVYCYHTRKKNRRLYLLLKEMNEKTQNKARTRGFGHRTEEVTHL